MAERSRTDKPVDMHRHVSIEFIKNSGNFAVRAPRGEKNPGKDWDPKTNSKMRSEQVLHDAPDGNFNLGLHFFGPLVDVDVDTDAPFLTEALDRFLPPCAHVWGRASKPRSHRAYRIKTDEPFEPSEYHILRRLDRIPEAKVEVRGGAQSRGEYSLLPGSVHPSGELYEWSDINRARSTMSETTVDQIIRGVRLAGAVAVIAPLWTEGSRNNLVMALSGFLYKAHTIAETLGGNTFALDRDQAESFIEALLDITQDEPGDRNSRMKTFNMTWRKADDGVAVTGATTLADIVGDKTVISKLYTLLTDSPDIVAIEEFTNRFVIWQGPGVVIDVDMAKRGATKPLMTRQNFVNSFGHKFIDVNGKRRLLADLLFHLESTTRVAGLTFEPGEGTYVDTREGKKVNQWSGFVTEPFMGEVTDEDVKPFLEYVRDVIASGDETIYNWVLGWICDIFQNPADKCRTALVLVGQQGAGKSFLGEEIIMPIIGPTHSAATKSVESITRDFNVLYDNKVFVLCNEAMNSRQRSTAAKLKSIITDKWMEVEPKGIDPYFKPNHMRFLFTSNDEEDAVNLEDGSEDRRYTVVKVSPTHVGKTKQYWAPLADWVGRNRERLLKWFLSHEYERTMISLPLATAAKSLMQQGSWNVMDAWLAAWVARNHPLADHTHEHWFDAPVRDERDGSWFKTVVREDWPQLVSATALTKDYASFARTYGRGEKPLNESQIGAALSRRGLRNTDDPRIRLRVKYFDSRRQAEVQANTTVYAMPSREDVIQVLEKRHGFVPEDLGEIINVMQSSYSKSEF